MNYYMKRLPVQTRESRKSNQRHSTQYSRLPQSIVVFLDPERPTILRAAG